MSVLYRRSLLVLALLFGLLFAVGCTVLWFFDMNIWYAAMFAVFIVGLQFALGPYIINAIFKINTVKPEDIRPELAQFLARVCAEQNIPVPSFGVIEDGNPNAFTYGHTPDDARVVVTRGLVDMLSEEELEAVVAHELGHIKHWDFVVMAIAGLVPLVLYVIYMWTRRDRKGNLWIVAVTSYVAYIVSQYIVLFLSRVREYYADNYSAEVTKNPKALASSLVSIAYGLAKAREPEMVDGKEKKKESGFNPSGAITAMGFFNAKGISNFAMSAADINGNFSMENMQKAMRWDTRNPWARWFEFNSTHPLTAKRIAAIEGQKPTGPVVAGMPDSTPSYFGKFLLDVSVALLPYTGAFIGLVFGAIATAIVKGSEMSILLSWVLFFGGIGEFIRLKFSYRSKVKPAQIVDLIGETSVSHIRPIPAEIKGKIIGRGEPGAFWSADLVLQDENGFITMLYRQPLSILAFLFGVVKAKNLVGREATVRGWYRRGPVPYFEMKEATFDNGETIHCYYGRFIIWLSALASLAGLFMILF